MKGTISTETMFKMITKRGRREDDMNSVGRELEREQWEERHTLVITCRIKTTREEKEKYNNRGVEYIKRVERKGGSPVGCPIG